MKYLTNLDLNKNELQNAVIQPLAVAPSNPKLGQIYCNSADKKIYAYRGSEIGWEVVGFTAEEKAKLDGIEAGAEVNVQANWTQSDTTKDDYIKNKPDLSLKADKTYVDTQLGTKVDKVTGKGLSTNDYDDTEKAKVAGAVQKDGTVAMTGALNMNSHKITGVTAGTANTDAVNKKQLDDAIDALPEPMVFKGSVGTGGTVTWANLPSASASVGYTYKVVERHTTAPVAEVGDTIISNGTEWVVIPSGDEPSGTVTSVAVTGDDYIDVSGSPITSSGTIALQSKLKVATGTLTAGQTSASVSVSGTIICVEVSDASTGDVVTTDVKYTSSGVTVTVAQAYTNALNIRILFFQ